QVASTFDDGPDPRWTPKILDILKTANAKAAFFLVGVNAENYPGLVRRIVNEGHEIGNHTYYHPNLALAWPEHVRLELNATQLLIETITGRATTLFRPPYAADTQPSQMSELMPLQMAQDLSYLVVLENIDPQDWVKPGADIIFRRLPQHDFVAPISIVIAAYNEEKVVAGTLRSLVSTDYSGELEIIVVDDGSRDKTAAEVEGVANVDPRVRLLRQENRGKARALQRALAA